MIFRLGGFGWIGMGLDLHDQLDHYHHPGETEVPMEPVQVHAPSTDDPACTPLFPEPPEAQEVLEDTDAAQCGCHDAEDRVGR